MKEVLVAVIVQMMPTILEIAGVGLAGALGWAALVAKKRFGLDIEKRHQDALHSALMSGVRAALQKGLTGNAVLNAAVDYARASVPDAIDKLSPHGRVLFELARAKLDEVAQGGMASVDATIDRAAAPRA